MASAVDFKGANMRLGPPVGADGYVGHLTTFTNGVCSVSCWELTTEELAEINRTGRVFVSVMSGRTQPPLYVGDEDSVRASCVDFGGVWTKGID